MKQEYIDAKLLDQISREATLSPRQRKNYNFHTSEQDASHRLLNAIEPMTYIPPHCHDDKDETIIVLRGKVGIIFFEKNGRIQEHALLTPQSDCVGVNIARGLFHSMVSLSPNTIFFESKAGPYRPLYPSEQACFAPFAHDPLAADYLRTLQALFTRKM